ncbi:hypothetical protein ABZ770_44070 [Streptomyces sp. NPDC006654]|uniref:hypothetical protein n=1 Tax=Streptomyces sp. NPDC006654 TaxID=3156897 RepID=UPI0033F2F505
MFSLETAVRMLQEAGYPIEDIAEEIERIQKRAFDQAARLADATGDNDVVREYPGLPKADPVQQVPLIDPANAGQTAPQDGQSASSHPAQPQPPEQLPTPGATGAVGAGGPGPR